MTTESGEPIGGRRDAGDRSQTLREYHQHPCDGVPGRGTHLARQPGNTRPTMNPQGSSTAVAVSLSVTELLRLAGDNDQAAWEEIMRRYHSLVLAKVRSFRLQDADAHDAVQMTWLRLLENRHRIQIPEHLGKWLATTASRECLGILRDAKRTPTRNDTAVQNVVDPSIGPEQHVIDSDTARTLRSLLAELAPRKRLLLRALFADEPPRYAELAHTTGVPPGSIGPTRARALQQLRQRLDENQLGQAQPMTPGARPAM